MATSSLLETLASYVPMLITRHLAHDPTPISESRSERFPAAVLFADISGFTALTERLAQRGPVGAEELTRFLNAYFGQLIELIVAHGGDVVKFAGDALLALWSTTGTDEDLATVTRRAALCSLEVQERLKEFRPAEDVRLSLRVALGAGDISTMHLGGVFGRWDFLVAGDPLIQVGVAGHDAEPGEVVLSPAAWALVRDACE